MRLKHKLSYLTVTFNCADTLHAEIIYTPSFINTEIKFIKVYSILPFDSRIFKLRHILQLIQQVFCIISAHRFVNYWFVCITCRQCTMFVVYGNPVEPSNKKEIHKCRMLEIYMRVDYLFVGGIPKKVCMHILWWWYICVAKMAIIPFYIFPVRYT